MNRKKNPYKHGKMPNGMRIPKSNERTVEKSYKAPPEINQIIAEGCAELHCGEGEFQLIAVTSWLPMNKQLKQEKTSEELSVQNRDLKDENKTLRKLQSDLWMEIKNLRTERDSLTTPKKEFCPLAIPMRPLPELESLNALLNQERGKSLPIPEPTIQKAETESVPELKQTTDLIEPEPEESTVPCNQRIRDRGQHWCAKKTPILTKIDTLKACKVCINKETMKKPIAPRTLEEPSSNLQVPLTTFPSSDLLPCKQRITIEGQITCMNPPTLFKKVKITEINSDICRACQVLSHDLPDKYEVKELPSEITNRQESAQRSRDPSNSTRKNAGMVWCPEGLWVFPTKCESCKERTYPTWFECQKEKLRKKGIEQTEKEHERPSR